MKIREFIEELKTTIEFDEYTISIDTNLRDIPGFDSLARMSILAFVDEKFSIKLSADQLRSMTTVKSLMEIIGLEKFEE